MNDADLLRLLEEKLPADFTPTELTALRARWNDSADIRAALAATLELETELATGLADVSLSVDDLMARAAARRTGKPSGLPRWWLAMGLTAVVMLAVGAGVWFSWRPSNNEDAPNSVTINTPKVDNDAATVKEQPAGSPTPVPTEAETSAQAALAATLPNDPQPMPAVIPQPVAADAPWAPWLNGELPPLALDNPKLRADLRTMGHDELPLAEFQRWWGETAGIAAGWNEAIIGGRRTVQIDGRMQLKAPWVDDAVLRLTPFDLTDMTLLFGDNDRGIALRFYKQREPHLWAAYEFQRPPGETAIKWGGLLTTDGGAWYRSGAVTFEVRRQNGQLILSAGKIPLLSVPFAEPPQVVQLLGKGRLRGFSWLRTEPWPLAQQAEHPIVLDSTQPEASKWQMLKPDVAMVHVEPGGSVLLTASSKTDEAQAFVPLPKATLVESIFRLSAADAGTGVYLGNEQGKPVALLGIMQDRRTKQLTFGALRPQERRMESDYDPNAFPPPYWNPHVWLRVVAGLGTCHVWSSGDGVHWGHVAENPLNDLPGAVRSIGLYCFPGETPRSIRLESYQVRELQGLTQFADDGVVQRQVPTVEKLPQSYDEWEAQTIGQLPDDVMPSLWMNHVGVAALKAGPSKSLAREIVERLAVSEQYRTANTDEQSAFLNDAVSLLDTWQEHEVAPFRRAYFYRQVATPAEMESQWSTWLQSPLWTHAPLVTPHWDSMATALQANAFASHREALATLAPDAQFWLAQGHPDHRLRPEGELVDRLARWSRSVVGLGERQDDASDVLPLGWRHPLQLTVNKEAYNVQSELQSALIGGTFQDAGRIAMNFGVSDGVGLLPDMDDDRLFVSIPVAMAAAVKDYPAFGEALQNDLGPTGMVRVLNAARQGDLATLRAATIQFYRTAAAAEAERVLGDRQMALGDFFGAQQRYRHAMRSANEEQRAALRSRMVLAESLGNPSKTPGDSAAVADTQLDGVSLTPLLQEIRSAAPPVATTGAVVAPPEARSRYRLEIKAQFDGQVGQNAGRGEFRHVDVFGRQFAVTVDAERFYVSNRFQVTAYQRDAGQQLWATSVGSDQGEAHGHRFTPMTPTLIGEELLVRRIIKGAIELACLKPADGQVLWKTRGGEKADIFSEPIALPGRIGVIVSRRMDDDMLDVRWAHLNPATGETVAEFPLIRLRDAWSGEAPCVLAVRDDTAVATIGGAIVSFETTGDLQWVRREPWLPPKVDPQAEDYLVAAPVFATGADGEALVVIAAPASRQVIGIEVTSGRVRWRSVQPKLQGILASRADVTVLALQNGLCGLSPATGDVLWSQPVTGRMTAMQIVDSQMVVAIQRESTGNKFWPQLAWFDLATGTPRGEAQIDVEHHPEWRCGPLFSVGSNWWTLISNSGNKPQRDLALLVPDTELSPQQWSDPHWDGWVSTTPGERRLVQSVLPGWQPIVAARNVFTAPAEPVREQRPVLIAKIGKANEPVRFVRTVTVPKTGTPSLQLRVGHQPGQRWQLEVRIGSRTVLSESVTDESAPSGWISTRVALFPFAGQAVTIQLSQKNMDEKAVEGLWREAILTGFGDP